MECPVWHQQKRRVEAIVPRSQGSTKLLLGSILALYVIAAVLIGHFPLLDVIPFKAAGLHWALSGHFAAPEMRGFQDLKPPLEDIYFAHLPGYAFLFGLFVKLFGFGPRQCLLYDALIHAWLAWLTFRTGKALAPALPGWLAVGSALLILPIGTSDRADELAICLGMITLQPLLHAGLTWPRALRVGVLFGLCAATSGGVAACVGLMAMFLRWSPPAHERVRLFIGAPIAACVALAACLGPIFWFHPTAYQQYIAHAARQLEQNRAEDYFFSLRYGWNYLAVVLATALVGGLALARSIRARGLARFVRLWGGAWVGLLGLLIFFPTKYLYTWFVGPWLIALCGISAWDCYREGGRGSRKTLPWLLVPVTILYVFAAQPTFTQALVLLSLPPEQTLAYNAAKVRELVPVGSRVLTTEFWWVLAADRHVIDPGFSSVKLSELDYLIFTANGSGIPGVPANPLVYEPDVKARFEPIWQNLHRQPLELFGVRLTRSAYGYGPLVLRRKE